MQSLPETKPEGYFYPLTLKRNPNLPSQGPRPYEVSNSKAQSPSMRTQPYNLMLALPPSLQNPSPTPYKSSRHPLLLPQHRSRLPPPKTAAVSLCPPHAATAPPLQKSLNSRLFIPSSPGRETLSQAPSSSPTAPHARPSFFPAGTQRQPRLLSPCGHLSSPSHDSNPGRGPQRSTRQHPPPLQPRLPLATRYNSPRLASHSKLTQRLSHLPLPLPTRSLPLGCRQRSNQDQLI